MPQHLSSSLLSSLHFLLPLARPSDLLLCTFLIYLKRTFYDVCFCIAALLRGEKLHGLERDFLLSRQRHPHQLLPRPHQMFTRGPERPGQGCHRGLHHGELTAIGLSRTYEDVSSQTCRLKLIRLLFQGCFTLVTNVMEANLGIIAGISFGIAFFQVPSIFAAFNLCCLQKFD